MPRVLLSASFPEELLLRQTPERSGNWEEFEFVTQAVADEPVDAWVVYDNLKQPIQQMVAPENTLLITGEPESLRRYRGRFTSQFGKVWTSHNSIRHPELIQAQEAQHWHYALYPGSVHGTQLGFDELISLPRPNKTKCMSVICSAKADNEDHRKRLEFVQELKTRFGEQVDVFGRGIRTVEDKSDAIYDYKYHVVLENDHSQYFMTEKLGDAFLGWSYPVYFGGPEAEKHYPVSAFSVIDIYKPREAFSIIQNVLNNETYEKSLSAIEEARNRVLHQNNFCNLLAEYARVKFRTDAEPELVELLPKRSRAKLVWRQIERTVWPAKRNIKPDRRAA